MKAQFKNKKFISAIGFLTLIALIWFIGPFVGLSVEDCLKLIFGVMLLWVFTLLIGQLWAARAGRLIEKMLRNQADAAVMEASADRRTAVNLVRNNLLAAIHTLKTSRLGKARGSAALYELPWYMIIGHAAAGKSTALLQSGLTFPFSEQGGSVQGVGGTRNCDWFFTTEGVLLDTAGRYATQTEDRDEWLGFLKLLKRYRSKAPVNGILVATSLPELVQYQSESFTTYAHQIRERIHEIEDTFELRMPVYLVFTKLDLLGGFSQFFESLDEAGRDRVWGATLSHELGNDFDLSREVERQCELLYRGLRQIGEEKLTLSRGVGGKPALFGFPHEFHALKEGVGRLVELLHENDPYHGKPLLRGFYFTSALQSNEQPHIAAAARVSSQFGLMRTGFEPFTPAASHGYFLCDLFREVLFPDQYLIYRQTRPRASGLRMAGIMAGVCTLCVSIWLLTQSWMGNSSMLDVIRVNQAQASELIAQDRLIDKLKSLTLLQKHVEELQQHRIEGAPWKIGMGLYQGHKLEARLRKQYFDGIRTLMLEPLQTDLEGALERISPAAVASAPIAAPDRGQSASNQPSAPARTPRTASTSATADSGNQPEASQMRETANAREPAEEGYDALKTYLMLADERKHLDADFLAEQMPRYWRAWLEAKRGATSMNEIDVEVQQLVSFYLSQLQIQAPDVPLIENKPPLVEEARHVLRNTGVKRPAKELVYNDLKGRANSRFPAVSVSRILDGRDEGLVTGAFTVLGAFTRDAHDKFMQEAITEASRGEIKGDDWVLASTTHDSSATGADVNRNRAEIEKLYRDDYVNAWMKFLQGLAVSHRPGDIAQAAKMLERLADSQNSPIKLILQRVVYEASWDNPAQIASAVQGAREKITDAGLGRSRVLSRAPDIRSLDNRYGPLGLKFAPLDAILDGEKQGTQLLASYLERLGRLKGQLNPIASSDDQPTVALKLIQNTLNGSGSEFAETMQFIDNTLLSAVREQAFKDILRPLLTAPLFKSYATLLLPVEQSLEESWKSEVYEQWTSLANKYPFSSTSQSEARFNEISALVGRGGTVDKYIEEYLNGLVIRRGGQLVPRAWAEMGVRFNPQFLSSVARLVSGSPPPTVNEPSRFELRAVPTPGLSEFTVEIDGQTLRYRNGPQPWQSFNWPGGGEAQGARIQAIANNGIPSTVIDKPGRMGLVRMFGASTRTFDTNMNTGQMEWRFEGPNGPQSVKLDFRMTGGANPMLLIGLGRVDLPSRITQQ